MNWAELNPDLVRHIATNVRDITDFIRFRAVCRHWRSAVHPSDLPQQLPCYVNLKWKSSTTFDVQFRQLFSEKVYTVPVNNVSLDEETSYMYGSSNGFVLIHTLNSSKRWLLLNPLTGFQVHLPFTNESKTFPIYFGPSCNDKPKSPKNGIDAVYVLSSNGNHMQDEVGKVSLWLYDDMKWTRIVEVPYSFDDEVAYCHGRLYSLSGSTGHTRVIDITTGDTISVICCPSPSVKLTYLVEANGDLLGVFRDFKLGNPSHHEADYQFEVYHLEDVGTNPYWKKLKCLGDRMLFFGGGYIWLCLKASNFEGCRGNCIYFYALAKKIEDYFFSILRYDLDKDTAEVIEWSDNVNRKWFVPSLS